ncbi:MAG: energy transducer TonB [Rickettsiales bacterium]
MKILLIGFLLANTIYLSADELIAPPSFNLKEEMEYERRVNKIIFSWELAENIYWQSVRPDMAIKYLVDALPLIDPEDTNSIEKSCSLLFRAIYSTLRYKDYQKYLSLCPDGIYNERRGVVTLANRLTAKNKYNEAIELLSLNIPLWPKSEEEDLKEGCDKLFALLFLKNRHKKPNKALSSCPEEQKNIWFADANRKYTPIIKYAPTMPREAVENDITGYVLVEYDINKEGHPVNIKIIESTNDIFNKESIKSVKKYRYLPTIIDGAAVEEKGVLNKISFNIDS